MHVAQRRSPHDELQGVDETEDIGLLGVLDLEAHHGAVEAVGQQAFDGRRVGVARVSGEVNFLDARMPAQPGGHAARVATLALHAQRQRLDAAHRQVGFERTEVRAERARQRLQYRTVFVACHNYAAQDVPVPGEELGGAVNYEIGAQFHGLHQHRRREGGVDNHECAVAVGDLGELVDLGHPQQRVRHGFHQHAGGLRLGDRGLEGLQVAGVGKTHVDATWLEHVHQQRECLSVEHVRRHDRLAAVGDGGQQSQMQRGHA